MILMSTIHNTPTPTPRRPLDPDPEAEEADERSPDQAWSWSVYLPLLTRDAILADGAGQRPAAAAAASGCGRAPRLVAGDGVDAGRRGYCWRSILPRLRLRGQAAAGVPVLPRRILQIRRRLQVLPPAAVDGRSCGKDRR